jgi:DNA mismatch repair protein MutL
MNPQALDVNVHPSKIEVRFSDDRFIHEAVRRAVQDALRSPKAVPELQIVRGRSDIERLAQWRHRISNESAQLTLEAQEPERTGISSYPLRSAEDVPVLWQLHHRYILSQIKSGLTIIDQHVAHERILYEKALASKTNEKGLSQQLLFPQTIELSPVHFSVLTDIYSYLEQIGFGIKSFGNRTVVIEAIPVSLKSGRERELLIEIIEGYQEYIKENNDPWEAIAKAFACKSAIKSGDKLSYQEMVSLIDQLFATQDPYHCPHGRPVVINLTIEELDKRFGR